jgi:hypothetical protein
MLQTIVHQNVQTIVISYLLKFKPFDNIVVNAPIPNIMFYFKNLS